MKKSGRSIHRFGVALAAFALCGLTATIASATPSTQIWIPSRGSDVTSAASPRRAGLRSWLAVR